jgi:hypothetical protein
MNKTFNEKRKFNGKIYDLDYRADNKREANEWVKKHAASCYIRIIQSTMGDGRTKAYLVYTRRK